MHNEILIATTTCDVCGMEHEPSEVPDLASLSMCGECVQVALAVNPPPRPIFGARRR